MRVSGLALIATLSLGASAALAQSTKPAAPALCPITPPGAKSPAMCPAKPQAPEATKAAPTLAAVKPFAHRPLHARTAPAATTPVAPPPVLAARPEPLPELPSSPVPYLAMATTDGPVAAAVQAMPTVPLTLTPLPMEAAPANVAAQGETAPARASAPPQAKPAQPLQTRGLSTGQDTASLGLADERNFSVKGLGDGQNLSALSVNMPTLIHQILANDEARVAATTVAPPPPEELTADFMERVSLSRQLMQVDGSDDLIRHLVNKVHMKLIVNEVNKYLNINSLPESERYRLSAIVATTASELSERILNLNARAQARMLNKAELTLLIGALDVESQRKLTRMRLEDDGALDKQAELEIQLAQLTIIKAYERK